MARREHLKLAAPAILEAVAAPNAQGWPRGGQTRIDIPNDHLQYALTWFLLAAALLAVYLAYHRAQGRLVLSNGD
jgi:surfeit locus 1 family protein